MIINAIVYCNGHTQSFHKDNHNLKGVDMENIFFNIITVFQFSGGLIDLVIFGP